jgi:hypothetical protein
MQYVYGIQSIWNAPPLQGVAIHPSLLLGNFAGHVFQKHKDSHCVDESVSLSALKACGSTISMPTCKRP